MKYDLCILGAGPGGFRAASLAQDYGASIAMIEKGTIGGVCLHAGCIPTKTFVYGAALFACDAHMKEFGISIQDKTISFPELVAKKDNVVETLHAGMRGSLKKMKVDYFEGMGIFTSPHTVKVGDKVIEFSHAIIATGSRPKEISSLPFEPPYCISSDEILHLKELPKQVTIVGGGFIGCEWASLLRHLGVNVTIIEMADHILPALPSAIAKRLEVSFKKRGISIIFNTSVDSYTKKRNGIEMCLSNSERLQSQSMLICIGRSPNIENIGLDTAGVTIDKGCIAVNEYMQTSVPNMYAIGDVIGGLQLAHVAWYEAQLAIQHLFKDGPIAAHYGHIPQCIYTEPEIALVGICEVSDQIQQVRVPLATNGKAHCEADTNGTLSLFYDVTDKTVVGCAIIGKHATELISMIGMAVATRMSLEQLSNVVFPHPTFSEWIGDALQGAFSKG